MIGYISFIYFLYLCETLVGWTCPYTNPYNHMPVARDAFSKFSTDASVSLASATTACACLDKSFVPPQKGFQRFPGIVKIM